MPATCLLQVLQCYITQKLRCEVWAGLEGDGVLLVPVKAREGQGTIRVVVDQGSGEGRGVSGGGEARKLLVSCSFNCLDWTCGQPSG